MLLRITPDDFAALAPRMIVFIMPLALVWPDILPGLVVGPAFGIALWACYVAGAVIVRRTGYDQYAAEWLAGALWAAPILFL